MTSVTKFYLSVDINFSLFSFLSDRYVFIPNDSDKSDKRSHGLLQQGLQCSDKSKTAMTKGVASRGVEFDWGFCHCVFWYIDGLKRPYLKALRLLSLLSLSLGEKEGYAPSQYVTGNLHTRKDGVSHLVEFGVVGGGQISRSFPLGTGRLVKFLRAGVSGGGDPFVADVFNTNLLLKGQS